MMEDKKPAQDLAASAVGAPGPAVPPAEPTIEREYVTPPKLSQEIRADSMTAALMGHDKNVARVVAAHYQKPREPWISEWNWASEAGDPCVRMLAYRRLKPEAALPPSEDLAFTFKHGHWVEKEALDELAGAGYEIVEQQRPFTDRKMKVRGKIDGKIVLRFERPRKLPFEIKGYAPNTWKRINTVQDLVDSDLPYLKKVPAQMMLYLMLDPEGQKGDAGILYLKNKLSGQPKQIVVPLDTGYAMWLWKRIRLVNEHVRRRKLPPRIEYDEAVCGRCPFRHVCLGEMPAGASPLVLDPERQSELLELLRERERLDPLRKQFEEVDDRVKELVKGHPKIILGDYIITGKEIEVGPQQKKGYTFWKKSILNVRAQRADDEA